MRLAKAKGVGLEYGRSLKAVLLAPNIVGSVMAVLPAVNEGLDRRSIPLKQTVYYYSQVVFEVGIIALLGVMDDAMGVHHV